MVEEVVGSDCVPVPHGDEVPRVCYEESAKGRVGEHISKGKE